MHISWSICKNSFISKIIEIFNDDIAFHGADYEQDNTANAVVVAHDGVGNILVDEHYPEKLKKNIIMQKIKIQIVLFGKYFDSLCIDEQELVADIGHIFVELDVEACHFAKVKEQKLEIGEVKN